MCLKSLQISTRGHKFSLSLVSSLPFGLAIPCGAALPDRSYLPLVDLILLFQVIVFRHMMVEG